MSRRSSINRQGRERSRAGRRHNVRDRLGEIADGPGSTIEEPLFDAARRHAVAHSTLPAQPARLAAGEKTSAHAAASRGAAAANSASARRPGEVPFARSSSARVSERFTARFRGASSQAASRVGIGSNLALVRSSSLTSGTCSADRPGSEVQRCLRAASSSLPFRSRSSGPRPLVAEPAHLTAS